MLSCRHHLREARRAALERAERSEAAVAERVTQAAERIEALAEGLSRPVRPSDA